MKGKSITFRPKADHRHRLDRLAEATERPVSFFMEKVVESALPQLEEKYKNDLLEMDKKKSNLSTYPPHQANEPRHIADRSHPKGKVANKPGLYGSHQSPEEIALNESPIKQPKRGKAA